MLNSLRRSAPFALYARNMVDVSATRSGGIFLPVAGKKIMIYYGTVVKYILLQAEKVMEALRLYNKVDNGS